MEEDCEIVELLGSFDSNEAHVRHASIKRTQWPSDINGDNWKLVEALKRKDVRLN